MKKALTLLWLFYVAIALFVFLEIKRVTQLPNGTPCLIFEGMGFLLAAWALFNRAGSQLIKIGFFVPWLLTIVLYSIALNVFNIVFVDSLDQVYFIFWNLVMLFGYLVITTPMYLLGKK